MNKHINLGRGRGGVNMNLGFTKNYNMKPEIENKEIIELIEKSIENLNVEEPIEKKVIQELIFENTSKSKKQKIKPLSYKL